jgi:hypothetical protein
MYYSVTTATVIPGKRFAAVEHMKKMVKLFDEKYGIPAEILGNEAGEMYKYHFVATYESMAQYEEVNDKLDADEEFGTWWEASEGLIDFQGSTHSLYRVYD